MPDVTITVQVRPIQLLERDLLRTDPNREGGEVAWRITTNAYKDAGVIVADYVDENGGEPDRHEFEDPQVLLTVERTVAVPERAPYGDPLVAEIFTRVTRCRSASPADRTDGAVA